MKRKADQIICDVVMLAVFAAGVWIVYANLDGPK